MSKNDFVEMTIFLCLICFFHLSQNTSFFFVFAFYAEIQDGRQKWRENNFWEKWSLDSADTLLVKNFVKINLCHTVSEINVFLHFTQKFKMAAKNGQENDFWGKSPVDSRYPADQKFRQVSEINTFFAFYAEIQDGHQKWRGNNFWGESKEYISNFVEIALSRTVYEKNMFLDFTQKFKLAIKNGRKTFFWITRQ